MRLPERFSPAASMLILLGIAAFFVALVLLWQPRVGPPIRASSTCTLGLGGEYATMTIEGAGALGDCSAGVNLDSLARRVPTQPLNWYRLGPGERVMNLVVCRYQVASVGTVTVRDVSGNYGYGARLCALLASTYP